MCGSYYSNSSFIKPEEPKEKSPVWKISDDKRHIVFYGARSFDVIKDEAENSSKCDGATEWCKKHCYLKTMPMAKNTNADYELDYFDPNKLHPLIKDDFTEAALITFFGSGTIGTGGNSGTPNSPGNFYCNEVEDVIRILCCSFPNKTFRFFLRERIKDRCKLNPIFKMLPDNAIVVFSVDRDTKIEDINWAIKSKLVSSVAVIDHPDNAMVVEYIEKRIKNKISCKECKGYSCFEQTEKTMVLHKYQEPDGGFKTRLENFKKSDKASDEK